MYFLVNTKWRSKRRHRSIAVCSRQDRNTFLDFWVKHCNEVVLYKPSTPSHSNNRWTIKIDPKRHTQICTKDNIQAIQRVDGGSHPGEERATAIGNLILVEEEESTLCKRGIVMSLLEIRAWREFSHVWKEYGRSVIRGCSLSVALSPRKSITLLLEAQLNCLLGLPYSHILFKYDYKS